jgi:hypothetical protein
MWAGLSLPQTGHSVLSFTTHRTTLVWKHILNFGDESTRLTRLNCLGEIKKINPRGGMANGRCENSFFTFHWSRHLLFDYAMVGFARRRNIHVIGR